MENGLWTCNMLRSYHWWYMLLDSKIICFRISNRWNLPSWHEWWTTCCKYNVIMTSSLLLNTFYYLIFRFWTRRINISWLANWLKEPLAFLIMMMREKDHGLEWMFYETARKVFMKRWVTIMSNCPSKWLLTTLFELNTSPNWNFFLNFQYCSKVQESDVISYYKNDSWYKCKNWKSGNTTTTDQKLKAGLLTQINPRVAYNLLINKKMAGWVIYMTHMNNFSESFWRAMK